MCILNKHKYRLNPYIPIHVPPNHPSAYVSRITHPSTHLPCRVTSFKFSSAVSSRQDFPPMPSPASAACNATIPSSPGASLVKSYFKNGLVFCSKSRKSNSKGCTFPPSLSQEKNAGIFMPHKTICNLNSGFFHKGDLSHNSKISLDFPNLHHEGIILFFNLES